jgi:hypothetical protein
VHVVVMVVMVFAGVEVGGVPQRVFPLLHQLKLAVFVSVYFEDWRVCEVAVEYCAFRRRGYRDFHCALCDISLKIIPLNFSTVHKSG